MSVRVEGSRLDVRRTFEQSRTRRRVCPTRSPGSLTMSEPREKPDSRRVIIACPCATGAAPPDLPSGCERRRPCIDIAPRAPRTKDMPPISLRAMICSSATACISGSMSLQVGGRTVQRAGQCASWAVCGHCGCGRGPHEFFRSCIARAALAWSSSSTCFAPKIDDLARPLGTNIQNPRALSRLGKGLGACRNPAA